MKRLIYILIILVFTSCQIDSERRVCNYNVQLRYDYNVEGTTSENRIEYNVHNIDEYIFDNNEILFATRSFRADQCVEYMHSEITLPQGEYSVIAVGNVADKSTVTANGAAPVIGVTHRDDMQIDQDSTDGDSENLYTGYRTFTVKQVGISRVRVDMVNAHLTLVMRITWKNATDVPARTMSRQDGNPVQYYAAELDGVPTRYSLMPEFIFPMLDAEVHDPDDREEHDLYLAYDNDVIHHIPGVHHHDDHKYRNSAYHVNPDNAMDIYIRTYRVLHMAEDHEYTTDEPDRMLRIYPVDGKGKRGATGDPVVEINMTEFFNWKYSKELDNELAIKDIPGSYRDDPAATKKPHLHNERRQYYELGVKMLDNGKYSITELDVADWEEGGTMTGTGDN